MTFNFCCPFAFALLLMLSHPLAMAQSNGFTKTLPPLSPSNAPAGGYTASSLTNQGGDIKLSTIIVDWTKDDVFLLTVDSQQVPRSCVAFDFVQDFETSGSEPVPIAFSFKILDTVAAPFYRARKGRPDEITDFSLPLPAVIERNAKARSVLDKSLMRELIACDAGGFVITNRMPAEARFFGYPVRSCLAIQNQGARQWFTNFNGSGVPFARVQHPDKDHGSIEQDKKRFSKEDCRTLFIGSQVKPWAKLYSVGLYHTVATANEISAKTLPIEKAFEREKAVFQFMEAIRHQFDLLLTDGTSLFPDPFVRGMMLEQALWRPQSHSATVTDLLSIVLGDLEASSGELSLSYSLHCAYANLGFAPNEKSHAILIETREGGKVSDLNAAAILARWRFPAEQRHVDATVEFIQTAKHLTDKLNCVETLILMEEFDSIPPDLMERWFAKINGDAAQIRRPLNLLMQNPSGRRYLADKYKAMPVDAPLREPIQALFANELSAVHHFGDYRFWTKEECKRLESDLQLETADATKP